MRRYLLILGLLILIAAVAVVGVVGGIKLANAKWTGDIDRLGVAMKRLDADIKAGHASTQDSDYLVKLCELPLERFDEKSVTYYAGPGARYSATIEFDESGIRGLSIDR
jgi:hypothetical protein